MTRRFHASLLASTAMALLSSPLAAGPPAPPAPTTLPQGPQTQGGSAQYNYTGPSLTVNQTSQNLITNWTTFNIGSSGAVQFIQPNSSAIALNRVTGDANPSQIFGSLTANGILFLVNPNGILFGQSAQINVGGLLATTHDINNSDFMAGRYNFNISGNPTASIVNQGTITAAQGGFAALVAPGVRNSGTITATLGTVGLAAGNGFTLDMYGDKLITLAVGDSIAGQVQDVATGQALKSLVANDGTLSANGGKVQITAAAAKTVIDSVINNTGVIEANAIADKGGTIVLSAATGKSKPAGAPVQNVKLSGTISAAGKNAGQKGGTIKVAGENIALTGATIDASGQAGGGTVMVGIDVPHIDQYMTPASTAATVTIDKASTINVSATGTDGNGGVIGIWSDQLTRVDGTLLGTGGTLSGNGGNAYIIGVQDTIFTGTTNLSSAYQQNSNQSSDNDRLFIASGNDITIGGTGTSSYVTQSALESSLAYSSVSINAGLGTISMPGFTSKGSITVAGDINWGSLSSLKLQANENVTVNAGVTIANTSALTYPDLGLVHNQNINLLAGQNGLGTGTVTLGDGAKVDASRSYANVNIEYNPPGGYANPFDYSPYVLTTANKSFLFASMLVNNGADLENINLNLAGNYMLVQSIDLGSIKNFVPIGNALTPFTGNFNGNGGNGNGNTISNLIINSTSTGSVGLFGVIGPQGVISNVTLTNVNVTANAASAVGALAGTNNGSIWQSSATGSVSSTGNGAVGGLVGINASVSRGGIGNFNVGISNSYANVAVTGGDGAYVGGLVGLNNVNASISTSYSAGAVTGGADSFVGGLAGRNAGSIQDTYAIGAVTGGSNSTVGGLVGFLAGANNCDCEVQLLGGTIQTSWASGAVSGPADNSTLGGLVGGTSWSPQALPANVINSYWDKDTTGQQYSAGGTGLSGSSPFTQASYQGFDFGNTWFMIDGQTRPFLQMERSGTITNAHQLQLIAMNPNSNYVIANNIDLGPALKNPSDMWSTNGFAPIGSDGNGFTGYLQGLGNTIDGLTIASSAPLLGLFGLIGPGGVVRDLNLTNVNITATNSGPMAEALTAMSYGQTVGALTATNLGLIENVNVSGAVSGAGKGMTVGGLVGVNAGEIKGSSAAAVASVGNGMEGGLIGFNIGSVSQSYATGAVTGSGDLGGLVGENYGRVIQSYSTGAVTLVGDANIIGSSIIGGLVGYNTFGGAIVQSSASGAVSGGNYTLAGGLAGANDPGAVISQSFATGMVSAGANSLVGGLVGGNAGTIEGSYSNGSTTGGANSYVGGLTGVNANFQGLSSNSYIGLISDSYATGVVIGGANSHIGGLVGDNGSQILQSFATGLVTGGSGSSVGGLVGVNSATFTNLYPDIAMTSGSITQSYATGAVTGGDLAFVGGLVGYNSGIIDTSSATGNVSAGATSLVGGLIGFNDISGTIVNSFATGAVSGGSFSALGGLVGLNLGSIDPSYATGTVTDTGTGSALGGLAGINAGSINQAAATGAVTGGSNSMVGGLVGINTAAGEGVSGTINQSYASGGVTGGVASAVGGLVGLNGGVITQTFAVGQVATGTGGTVGGLVASNTVTAAVLSGVPFTFGAATGTVVNSFFDTQTTGQLTSAGGIGLTTAQLTAALPTGLNAPFNINAGATFPFVPGLPVVVAPAELGEPPVATPAIDPVPPITQQIASFTPPTNPTDPNTPLFTPITLGPTEGTGGTGGAGGTGGTTGSTGGRAGGNGAPPGTRLIDMPVIPLPPGSGMPPPGEARFSPNEVVFQIGNGVSPQQVAEIAARFGLTVVSTESIDMLGRTVYTFNINGKSVREVIGLIEASKLGGAVQPNYTYGFAQQEPAGTTKDADPNATMGDPAQYVIGKFQLAESHRLARGDNVIVAVIDSEIDTSHPDLAGVVTKRFDAGCGATAPDTHGTGMTGAIAAHRNLMGVAPNVKIIAICAFGGDAASAESTSMKIIKGLDYAIAQGARVINMSFAGPRDPALAQALQIAREKGIVLVGAAGNAGPKSPPLYPGADPNVIAVTATDDRDHLFTRANQGKYIAVAAPGVDILVPAPNNSLQLTTGTSVATAHVSGVAALLIAQKPSRTPEEIRAILMSTAKDLGPKGIDPQFGAGLVDPLKALRLAPPAALDKTAALTALAPGLGR